MSDENQDIEIDVSNTSITPIIQKKKKPFVMVKSGINSNNNIADKDEDEESYVKTLLNDKSLIEEDIVLSRPNLTNLNTDLMSNSGSSVVITPTNNSNNHINNLLNLHNDNKSESITHSNDLNYSDSDFESNLIDRLDKPAANQGDMDSSSSSDYSSDEIVVLDPIDKNDDNSDGNNDITSSDDEINKLTSSDSSDDDDDDEILPVNPATLDKKLYYAVHKFLGPESSHCPLKKNEECIVLNDDDVYWWLVRRVRDGRIGFVPGELLEGWNDKLARWNTFINEKQSKETVEIEESDDSSVYEDKDIDKNIKSNSSLVKFDANVTYVPYDSMESVYSGSLQEELNFDEDEMKSDVSFGSMPKLQIKKNGNINSPKKHVVNIDSVIEDNKLSDSDEMYQWKPRKPSFTENINSSPSGSIGEYSTSEPASDSSVYEDSPDVTTDDDNLHDDVSREYTPLLERIDDLVNRLS